MTPVSDEYEELARSLISQITHRATVQTVRLERDVHLQGEATGHQIDVLWEFRAAESAHRILFECRHYGSTIKQKDILALKGVVDDLTSDGATTTTGVMVTLTGYQSGAKRVAETYGLIVLELRAPNDADVAGRLMKIEIALILRTPYVRDIRVQSSEPSATPRDFTAWGEDVHLETVSGERKRLVDVLLEGELAPFSAPPTPCHQVRRLFDPPAKLMVEDSVIASVDAIEATVGETEADPYDMTVGGRENLAWLLKNTVTGSRAWFTTSGGVHVTD